MGQKKVSKKGPPQGSTSGIEWSVNLFDSTGATNNKPGPSTSNQPKPSTNNKPKPFKGLTIKKGSMKFILTDGIDPGP